MRSFQHQTVSDRYFLEELVGEGNFGGVFRSEQRFLGVPVRRVAVKLSKHTGLDLDSARVLFHLYDIGLLEPEGRAYVAMEYVPGTTLAAQFRSLERVPAPQLVKWVTQICIALGALHDLPTPVVHRDLKPDNVLLGADLAVRVVDFGLAARLLAHGVVPGVAGTVAYMAPETSQGRSTPASDVYSVGLILYEGLTGQLPFAHLVPPLTVPHTLHPDWLCDRKRTIRPVPPSSRSNTSTAALDEVVLRCLEFDPARRYRNASELLHALGSIDERVSVPPGIGKLAEARAFRADGDLAAAKAVLRAVLDTGTAAPDVRFALLRELAGVSTAMGDHGAAVVRLSEALALTDDAVILRTRAERAALLEELADGYRGCGNLYQARRYDELARAELDHTGGRGVRRV